jgi:hypothetical protein
MSSRNKLSDEQIKRALIADAENPKAWEAPISVGPSTSPRPEWYGRGRHLELSAKFFVLSLLHRLGAEANLTYLHPDNVDITAVRESGEAITFDVKTLLGTTTWRRDDFRARKNHYVVFVCFQPEWRDLHVFPDVFIWASENLRSLVDREKNPTISLDEVASKLDPTAAWKNFVTGPAV